jgi:hypothetical protein
VKSDALLRLLIADLVGAATTRETFGTLRDELADLRARLDDMATAAEHLPHRRDQLLLVVAFLRKLLELHDELVDDVEQLFAPGGHNPEPPEIAASG